MPCQFENIYGADPEQKKHESKNCSHLRFSNKLKNPASQTSNQVNFSALDLLNETHHTVCLDIL